MSKLSSRVNSHFEVFLVVNCQFSTSNNSLMNRVSTVLIPIDMVTAITWHTFRWINRYLDAIPRCHCGNAAESISSNFSKF